MAIRTIHTVGDPVLTKVAEKIQTINEDIRQLAKDMVQTMHEAPGVGLSAPQVNVSRRLITIDLSIGKNADELIILVNPEILSQEGSCLSEEGCLSVPGYSEKVDRPARVKVKGLDLDGEEIMFEAEDLLARAFCHEIDHLDGKLFIDRLSPLKRQLIKRKLRKELPADKRL
ncbi:MAG: peptide deformylase [Candidatus Aminicenantes bacterium]|nr:peptide deformylase [Candidatus Aminicenantes bacterium]